MGYFADKYPSYGRLRDRAFFLSGGLVPGHIIWDDEVDIGTDYIYEYGGDCPEKGPEVSAGSQVSYALTMTRRSAELTQKQLAEKSGINQADISKIERGVANPTVDTLERLAAAMGTELLITFDSGASFSKEAPTRETLGKKFPKSAVPGNFLIIDYLYSSFWRISSNSSVVRVRVLPYCQLSS